ncbi:MAG: YicC/YloC family endoribonuclease [Acidobacteriota bacterium]|nr:YicC/YloC family endoribonuclease [Acidobacteriota bacterium]
MIKSMTGFASVTREHELATVGVTARSVNHRYLDTQLRLPAMMADQESELRGRVQRWVARGRVELAITVRSTRPPEVDVVLNESLVNALSTAVAGAEQRGLTSGGLASGDLLRFPQAVVVRERETDDTIQASIKQVAVDAVDDTLRELDAMRTREGEYLRADLETKRDTVAGLVEQLDAAAESGRAGLVDRLTTRVGELRDQLQVDESVVAHEVVRFAARSDVNEELARLRGHLTHWSVLADAPEPCGRKLDFLLQEMNREINTLGAKVESPDASELIVAAKAELEKLREQAANVE